MRVDRSVSLAILISGLLGLSCPFAFPASSKETANPLWVVTKGNSKVFLLGSIHLMNEGSYPMAQAIEKAYVDAGEVLFEADMRAMNRADTQARLAQLGTYPAGLTLKNSVSEGAYDRLADRFGKSGIAVGKMDRYRPWYCGIALTMLEIRKLGYDLRHGAEQHFFGRAVADGKRTSSLESLEEQFAMFSGLSPVEDEELLLQTLDDLDMVEGNLDKLRTAWRTGDVEALSALLHTSLKKHPIVLNRLFAARNQAWLPKIEARLADQRSTLVIVGAAHLLGEKGLLKLLEGRGLSVRQL